MSVPCETLSSSLRVRLDTPSSMTGTPLTCVLDAKIALCCIFPSFSTKFLYDFKLWFYKFPVRSSVVVSERPDSQRSVATISRSQCVTTPFRSTKPTMSFSTQSHCIDYALCILQGFELQIRCLGQFFSGWVTQKMIIFIPVRFKRRPNVEILFNVLLGNTFSVHQVFVKNIYILRLHLYSFETTLAVLCSSLYRLHSTGDFSHHRITLHHICKLQNVELMKFSWSHRGEQCMGENHATLICGRCFVRKMFRVTQLVYISMT